MASFGSVSSVLAFAATSCVSAIINGFSWICFLCFWLGYVFISSLIHSKLMGSSYFSSFFSFMASFGSVSSVLAFAATTSVSYLNNGFSWLCFLCFCLGYIFISSLIHSKLMGSSYFSSFFSFMASFGSVSSVFALATSFL